jgi:hypothetical protein
MRRLWARYRNIDGHATSGYVALGVTRARQFAHGTRGIRDSNRSRHRGPALQHPDPTVNADVPTWIAPCTRPSPRLQWIRHTEVRCRAPLGRTPALALDLWTTPARTKPSWASFFPAAAPPRAISRVGPRRTGSSRPLRSKKHAHSGPPLRCGRHGSVVRRRP